MKTIILILMSMFLQSCDDGVCLVGMPCSDEKMGWECSDENDTDWYDYYDSCEHWCEGDCVYVGDCIDG